MVFFAMELLKGRDLHEEIARARLAGQLLPWQRSKKIFLQICAALTAAHALGIIHRDLKPENIYLVEFLGDPDFVKLLDFGIAKLTEVAEGERKLTRTGMLFGTPEYMSPEQARGDNVDERVDVYAMGCILFQLVTGRVPFEAENFMGVLSLHLTQPPPVIPLDVFDSIGAPRALAQVIDKALAKDRNQRYPKVDELARAVRLASGDKPTGPVVAQANVAAPSSTATLGRVKTQWTGNLSVPEMEVAAPPPKSRLSLYIGAAILIGGTAAAAAMLVGRGGGGQAPSGGSAGSQVQAAPAPGPGPAPAAGSAATPPPPVPSPPVPPPPSNAPLAFDRAQIRLDSAPRGAEIKDLSSGKVIGKTPLSFGLTASRAPRQFALHHRDYVDAVVEVIPDRERIEYTEKLERGSATAPVVHQADPTRPPSARPDPTRPPGQVPSSGSPGPSGTPGAGSDVPEIKPAPPAGRPETAPPRPPAPGDDDSIQLKPDPTRLGNGSGQGSGSGSP
jgi:serine/threonine-protein kinase